MLKKIDKKFRDTQGVGIVELVLFIALVVFLVLCLIKWHNDEQVMDDRLETRQEYMSTTAGITYYMARLEYHCMQNAVPIEIEEAGIETVSEPYFMEEARELEANYDAMIESAEESTEYFTGWMELVGYIPEDWEIEEAIQMTMDENGNMDDETVADTFSVICNRCRDPRFPSTIHEVLYQPYHWQPVLDGTVGKWEITDRVREICADVISEGVTNSEIVFVTAGEYSKYCIPMYHRGGVYFGK